jgi:hypothetical protein
MNQPSHVLTARRQAKALQESLLQIVDRVESVKTEHEKLDKGNRFLQSYDEPPRPSPSVPSI